MPVIYLRHPIHGAKVATLHLEAEYDEQNGWEQFDPTEPDIPEQEFNTLARRGRRKKTEGD